MRKEGAHLSLGSSQSWKKKHHSLLFNFTSCPALWPIMPRFSIPTNLGVVSLPYLHPAPACFFASSVANSFLDLENFSKGRCSSLSIHLSSAHPYGIDFILWSFHLTISSCPCLYCPMSRTGLSLSDCLLKPLVYVREENVHLESSCLRVYALTVLLQVRLCIHAAYTL